MISFQSKKFYVFVKFLLIFVVGVFLNSAPLADAQTDDSTVFVVQVSRNVVSRLDLSILATFPVFEPDDEEFIYGLGCSEEGKLYASVKNFESNAASIIEFDQSGQNQRVIFESDDIFPIALSVDPQGNVWFIDSQNNFELRRIWRINPNEESPEAEIIVQAAAFDSRVDVRNITSDTMIIKSGPFAGDLLVTLDRAKTVLRLSAPGFSQINSFIQGDFDFGEGQPTSMTQTDDGRIFVSGFTDNEVHVFTNEGVPIPDDQGVYKVIDSANRIEIDKNGILYINSRTFERAIGGLIRIFPNGSRESLGIADAFEVTICES